MASSSPHPCPWYMEQKYQNYWESFSRLNISGSCQSSRPEDIRAIAYWRSLALSLQFENNQLHTVLSQMIGANNLPPGTAHAPAPTTDEARKKKKKIRSHKRKTTKENHDRAELQADLENAEYCPDTDNYNVDEEEELDEGYLRFLEETERHREERDRLRKAEEEGGSKNVKKDWKDISQEDDEEETLQSQADLIAVDHERLKREMSSLYGGESLAVHCVETRLQLEFNDWSDLHRPVTWPALPLNIRR